MNFVYYRLVQVDFNGATETLGPVVLRSNSELIQSVSVYPNPTKDKVNVVFKSQLGVVGTISLTDMTGRILQKRALSPTSNKETFSLGHLDRGFYFITISDPNNTYSHKVLVH